MKTIMRALVSIVILLTVGCSVTPKHTITAEEVVRRIENYLQETIRSVPSTLRFSLRRVDTSYTGGCTKWPVGDDFTGQIMPSVSYTATISKDVQNEANRFPNAVAAYWKGKSSPVENRKNDFAIRPYKHYSLVVTYYQESRLVELLGVLDDCIWRYGTPQPDDNP